MNEPDRSDEAPEKGYWKRLLAEKPDRHIELFLTLAISFFAAVQLIVTCSNNGSTTKQTSQLIAAAQLSAYAAKDNVEASTNFANSAHSINEGIGNAVDELNRQARIADMAREDSATAAQQALQATLHNFREDQRAWVGISDYEISPIVEGLPVDFRIHLINSGKTPALHFKVDAHGWFWGNWNNLGEQKIYQHQIATPPRGDSVIAPEASHIVRNEYASEVVSPEHAAAFRAGDETYYITGRVEYIDATQGLQTMTFCIDYSEPGPNVKIAPSPRLCEHGNTMSY